MIKKSDIFNYVRNQYGIEADHPWTKYPDYAVLRHRSSHKWFGLIMQINENKLGLVGNQLIDVINLKCDPFLISTLKSESGVYPAYHMNKEHWLTISLNSHFSKEKLFGLVDLSYDLTNNH